MQDGFNRFSVVDVKRERVSTEREEIKELKHKELEDRLENRRKTRTNLHQERLQWSMTVLQKHKKQESQVKLRELQFSETILAKKELTNLKKGDQSTNLKEILQAYRDDINRVKKKHFNLQKQNNRSRVKLEKLQLSQRMKEMVAKNLMFANVWSQTIKPPNLLGDIVYKEQILKPTLQRGTTKLLPEIDPLEGE